MCVCVCVYVCVCVCVYVCVCVCSLSGLCARRSDRSLAASDLAPGVDLWNLHLSHGGKGTLFFLSDFSGARVWVRSLKLLCRGHAVF